MNLWAARDRSVQIMLWASLLGALFWYGRLDNLSYQRQPADIVEPGATRMLANRVAVCISGTARNFHEPLSLATIKAGFSTNQNIEVDFFTWITNDPRKGDTNSKNESYKPVSDGQIRSSALFLSRSSPHGTYVLNENNYKVSKTCNFGKFSSELFDRSDEDVITRQTQPLFKKEKCYGLILDAEEDISLTIGEAWQYTTIASIRPDIFFFSPVPNSVLLSSVPVFPPPAHGSAVAYPNGHIPNDHIAFLPRKHAEAYFHLGRPFRTCTGDFSGPLATTLITNLLVNTFAYDEINSTVVVPYNLNRLGTSEGLCVRVDFYEENGVDIDTVKYWRHTCDDFVSWFEKARYSAHQTGLAVEGTKRYWEGKGKV